MINSLLIGLKAEARIAARHAFVTLLGGVLLLAAILGASAAGWVALAQTQGAMFAWLTLSGIYATLGIVCLAVGRRRPKHPMTAHPAMRRSGIKDNPLLGAAALAEAFAVGVASGMRR